MTDTLKPCHFCGRSDLAAAPAAPVQHIPGWRWVPVEPTAEWVDALSERGMRIGTLRNAIADVLAAAPQADSQPAPVLDYPPLPQGWPARFRCDSCDGNGEVGEPMYMGHFQPPERARCPDCDGRGWCSEEDAFSADHMRAYVDADRASRASADSGAVPAGVVGEDVDAIALARYKVVPAHESMFHHFAVVAGDGKQQLYLGREVECENMARKFAGAFLDGAFYQANIAPTPPAQAADSVLEDVDPLQGAANWLAEAHGQFCVAVLQGSLMIGYNRAKRLHDAAIAARKQGGA